jgi:hypothetical protein
MAVTPIKSKGTVITIGSQVTGVLDLELPDPESETYEADYLDNTNAAIPYLPTGRTEPGKISGNAWFSNAAYSALLTLMATPGSSFPCNATITLSNNQAINFTLAGVGLGGTVAAKEGIKAKFTGKLASSPTMA